jgi:type IV secretory pathway VirB2 component (pilin)
MTQTLLGIARKARSRTKVRLLGGLVLAQSHLAHAAGSLSEAENAATWVLNIFSPTLLLVLLTLLLIGCGLAVYFGRMTGKLFVSIMVGSVLVFGARTIAPRIVAIF